MPPTCSPRRSRYRCSAHEIGVEPTGKPRMTPHCAASSPRDRPAMTRHRIAGGAGGSAVAAGCDRPWSHAARFAWYSFSRTTEYRLILSAIRSSGRVPSATRSSSSATVTPRRSAASLAGTARLSSSSTCSTCCTVRRPCDTHPANGLPMNPPPPHPCSGHFAPTNPQVTALRHLLPVPTKPRYCLHTAEATGSRPVSPTIKAQVRPGFWCSRWNRTSCLAHPVPILCEPGPLR